LCIPASARAVVPDATAPFALLLFHVSGDPRDLQSFPTRRSSDLKPAFRHLFREGNDALPVLDETPMRSGPDADILAIAPVNEIVDRKSTRLNSSHVKISYAVFCWKKKKPATHSLPRIADPISRTG